MKDAGKTKKQLLEELHLMREKIAKMESQDAALVNWEEREHYFIRDIRQNQPFPRNNNRHRQEITRKLTYQSLSFLNLDVPGTRRIKIETEGICPQFQGQLGISHPRNSTNLDQKV